MRVPEVRNALTNESLLLIASSANSSKRNLLCEEGAMFVGREKELAVLEDLYARESFQFIVLYGRRCVGKTALIERFAEGKRTLFFTAQEQNDRDNLRDFPVLHTRSSRFPKRSLRLKGGATRFSLWRNARTASDSSSCSTSFPMPRRQTLRLLPRFSLQLIAG